MEIGTFFLWFLTIVSLSLAGFSIFLYRKMDLEKARMENFVIRVGQAVSDYRSRIDSLFEQSIHYYDDTIYQFVEATKETKNEIDDVLAEYDDLKEFIIPELSPEEKVQQEKELIGIAKNYPLVRSFEKPNANN